MNKKLLAALVAMSVATTANAETTIYGKVNVSWQSADEGEYNELELRNNASRLGFKGTEDLGNGLTAIYQLETGVNFDDKGSFSKRNTFIGLKGNFGTVRAGYFDTPTKSAQGKVDLFNDMEGDIATTLTTNDVRAQNSVAYTTPSSSPVAVNVQVVNKEEADANTGVSVSGTYTGGGLYVALGYDQDVYSNESNALRAVGIYTLGAVQLGLLVEKSEDDAVVDNDAENGFLASIQYNANDAWALKAQYGTSDIKFVDGKSLSVGADYKLAKNFKLQGYITQNEGTTRDDQPAEIDNTYVGVGAELKF
ncbi:porin [Teredinibacter waterburyi]|uniref:porin n=1 Tax=Teredinibacter waterburyi TaxID=1500538 RepID=UPI00165F4AF0|nr:porin [Teredinibacter waterburyi]